MGQTNEVQKDIEPKHYADQVGKDAATKLSEQVTTLFESKSKTRLTDKNAPDHLVMVPVEGLDGAEKNPKSGKNTGDVNPALPAVPGDAPNRKSGDTSIKKFPSGDEPNLKDPKPEAPAEKKPIEKTPMEKEPIEENPIQKQQIEKDPSHKGFDKKYPGDNYPKNPADKKFYLQEDSGKDN